MDGLMRDGHPFIRTAQRLASFMRAASRYSHDAVSGMKLAASVCTSVKGGACIGGGAWALEAVPF